MKEFDKFRFGVFEGGLFSKIWSAWTQGNEFYLGVRTLLQRYKVSFHGSGVSHVKITPPSGPVITNPRWRRAETPEHGAVHIASVCFPGGYNKGFNPAHGTPKKKLFGIEAAPEGEMIEFGFFLSREEAAVSKLQLGQIGMPIVRKEMPSGISVAVVARRAELNEESRAALRNLQIPVEAMPHVLPGGRMDDAAAILMNEPDENTPIILTSIQGFSLVRGDR
jgi:hypothetical protein